MSFSPFARIVLALILLGLLTVAFYIIGPIPQDPAYHQFADCRAWAGLPNAANVLTNIPFILVGLGGLIALARGNLVQDLPKSAPAYAFFFFGVLLTGFGSAYYHSWPDNDTLVWDRLPMTIAFMALSAALLDEWLRKGLTKILLYPAMLIGIITVAYWHITESQGYGDLRPYALVQFLPILGLPVLCLTTKSRFTRQFDLFAVLGFYILAKVFESSDIWIDHLTRGWISGHPIKHMLAAAATYCVLRMLVKRSLIVSE